MATAGYRPYGASAADFVGDGAAGGPLIIKGAVDLTVWDADTGGAQVTDLLTETDVPITVVTTDSFGNYRFQAPDTSGTLWVSTATDGSGTRYAVPAADLTSRVSSLEATAVDLQAAADTVTERAARPLYEWDPGTATWVLVSTDRPEYEAIMPGDEAATFPTAGSATTSLPLRTKLRIRRPAS